MTQAAIAAESAKSAAVVKIFYFFDPCAFIFGSLEFRLNRTLKPSTPRLLLEAEFTRIKIGCGEANQSVLHEAENEAACLIQLATRRSGQ